MCRKSRNASHNRQPGMAARQFSDGRLRCGSCGRCNKHKRWCQAAVNVLPEQSVADAVPTTQEKSIAELPQQSVPFGATSEPRHEMPSIRRMSSGSSSGFSTSSGASTVAGSHSLREKKQKRKERKMDKNRAKAERKAERRLPNQGTSEADSIAPPPSYGAVINENARVVQGQAINPSLGISTHPESQSNPPVVPHVGVHGDTQGSPVPYVDNNAATGCRYRRACKSGGSPLGMIFSGMKSAYKSMYNKKEHGQGQVPMQVAY